MSTTVTGTKLFKTVTKITVDSATAGNVSAGTMGNGTDEGKDIPSQFLVLTLTMSRFNFSQYF